MSEIMSPEWFHEKAAEQKYIDYDAETRKQLSEFSVKYGPKQLKTLSGKELLNRIFYNDTNDNENLCCTLELNHVIRENFGSIAGGSAFKFQLFFHHKKRRWMGGSSQKSQEYSEEEAVRIGTRIRDQLVAGAEVIAQYKDNLKTISDYEKLYAEVSNHIRLDPLWILKYYRMVFPDLFCSAYSGDAQRHFLYALHIQPNENSFVRMGQLAIYAGECGISTSVLTRIIADTIGWYKPIYRIGTGTEVSFFDDWKNNGYCAIGWDELGDLSQCTDEKGKADKSKIEKNLLERETTYNSATASRKANELVDFIDAVTNETIVVAMKGQMLQGIGSITSGLYYSAGQKYANRRKVEWKAVLDQPAMIPVFEGKLTTFHLMKDEQNMMLFYDVLIHGKTEHADQDKKKADNEQGFRNWLERQSYEQDVIEKKHIQILNSISLVSGASVFDASADELQAYYDQNLRSADGRAHTDAACAMRRYLIYLGRDENGDEMNPIRYVTGYGSSFDRNRIIFGAPGTGKSYTLNREKEELLANGGEYERVTFHPDYTYAHFVGTYKPVPTVNENGRSVITYKYVPGPFMRLLVKAMKNSREQETKPYLLIVEEINRANVAAVFGDIFQLLDRDDHDASEYPIQASEDMRQYFAEQLGGSPLDYAEIRLPDNFFIWATMNSADQGVFTLDTAFKRRWEFTYLGINQSEEGISGKKVLLGRGAYQRLVEWNVLRRAINDRLSSFRINEDKLLGPYFLSKKIIPAEKEIDTGKFIEAFKNKVLMYLYDDAARQKRAALFADDVDSSKYSSVCDAFEERGVNAFCTEIGSVFSSEDDDPEEV